MAFRIEESLHFANISQLKELMGKLELQSTTSIDVIIIDASNIAMVDAGALQILQDMVRFRKTIKNERFKIGYNSKN
jgi:MFS superfamily sulfate permease-like transporter